MQPSLVSLYRSNATDTHLCTKLRTMACNLKVSENYKVVGRTPGIEADTLVDTEADSRYTLASVVVVAVVVAVGVLFDTLL